MFLSASVVKRRAYSPVATLTRRNAQRNRSEYCTEVDMMLSCYPHLQVRKKHSNAQTSNGQGLSKDWWYRQRRLHGRDQTSSIPRYVPQARIGMTVICARGSKSLSNPRHSRPPGNGKLGPGTPDTPPKARGGFLDRQDPSLLQFVDPDRLPSEILYAPAVISMSTGFPSDGRLVDALVLPQRAYSRVRVGLARSTVDAVPGVRRGSLLAASS